MTSVIPARRRAEEFAARVDRPDRAGSDDRYSTLLALVSDLRSVEAPAPRPEFVADLRERLLVEADTALLPLDLAAEARLRLRGATPATRPNRRLAAAAGAIAMVGASASLAVAAQASLPGDTLYPVKRALEGAQTGITLGQPAKGMAMLDNASGRLEEATRLAQRGGSADLRAVDSTLATFAGQSQVAADSLLGDYTATGNETSVEAVRDFTAASMRHLEVIRTALPDEAGDSAVAAARVIEAIDKAAADLCPSCAGEGVGQVPQVLLFSAGQAPDEVASALQFPEAGPQQPIVPEEPGHDIDLPDLDGPVEDSATGMTGVVPQDPTVAPTQPGSKGKLPKSGINVGKSVDDLTRGLTGGTSDDPSLVGELSETVDSVLDPLTSTIEQTLNGLLGGG